MFSRPVCPEVKETYGMRKSTIPLSLMADNVAMPLIFISFMCFLDGNALVGVKGRCWTMTPNTGNTTWRKVACMWRAWILSMLFQVMCVRSVPYSERGRLLSNIDAQLITLKARTMSMWLLKQAWCNVEEIRGNWSANTPTEASMEKQSWSTFVRANW